MGNKLRSLIKKLGKSLLLLGLVLTLTLSHADRADAAFSGGRMGGGSFRSPSRSYSAPRTYAPRGGYSGGYGGGYGGGFGFPFLLPFFGFGGGFGGLFSILIFIAVANFLVQNVRRITGGNEEGDLGGELTGGNSSISVAKVQVGLLASARDLQPELNKLAMTADTSTAAGRSQVLQETTLALLRHPEYWAYGTTDSQKTNLVTAEAKFNQLALGERSKFSAETLSNVNAQLREAAAKPALGTTGELANINTPGEYIVVTLIVGAEGKLELPKINGAEDLQQAIRQIGSVGGDRLLAVEILWTPQATGDTLTTDDVMANYPDFKIL